MLLAVEILAKNCPRSQKESIQFAADNVSIY